MRLQRFISTLALGFLASCGGRAALESAPAVPRDALGFGLRVLEDSFVGGGQAELSYETSLSGGGLVLRVKAAEASALRAAYLDIYYDAAQYTPLAAVPSGLLSGSLPADLAGSAPPPEGLLALGLLAEPGVVHYGEVLANWDRRSGFSGSGVLATLRFKRAPNDAPRRAASPPASAASQSQLSYDGAAGEYRWNYASQGDCDANGEVNISDLTPLGLHFAETGPFSPDSELSLVDADGNGEINISDLTPIGANFGRRVEGYRLYLSSSAADYPAGPADPNGAGAGLLGETAYPAGSFQDYAGQRRRFHIAAAAPLPGAVAWARPYQGSELGIPSTPCGPGAPSNQAPLAAISATSAGGPAPLGVDFSAAASSDPEAGALSYRWDLDGDGVLETDSGSSAVASFVYTSGGAYHATVVVSDPEGLSASASAVITVTGGGVNIPPNITSITCSPDPISSGGHGLLRVVFEDPDNAGFSGSATPDAGTVDLAPPSGLPLTMDFYFNAPVVAVDTGINIDCQIDDGTDSDTDSLVVNVLAPLAGNSPPAVGGLSIAPDPLPGGDTGTISLTAGDLDGDPLSVTWVHDGNNGYITGSGLSVDYHSYTLAAVANVVVTAWLDDQHGHSVSQPLSFQVVPAANDPPTVSLGADTNAGARPLHVNFTATASDPDGDALTYNWDFDDNGSVDYSSSAFNTAANDYLLGASYTARVTVDDGHGHTATDAMTVSVDPSWSASVLDPAVNSGSLSSLTDRGGVPGVAYYYFDGVSTFQTQYLEATDPFGNGWSGGTIGPGGGDGLAAVSSGGVLGVGVYDTALGGTPCTFNRYLSPGVVSGTNISLISGDGLHMSGADINGQPALAWCYLLDASTYELHYARATDAASDVWNPPVIPDSAANYKLGFYNSLALINGRPAIAYSDQTTKSLIYVRALDASGSSWASFATVALPLAGEDYSGDCALVDAGGRPGVFYTDSVSGNLWFRQADDADGSAWSGTAYILQSSCSGPLDACVVAGLPACAYVELSGWLRFVHLNSADGSAQAPLETIDSSTAADAPSLREVGGYPCVSFYDSTNQVLKYGVKY